jgi:hypothetical protein
MLQQDHRILNNAFFFGEILRLHKGKKKGRKCPSYKGLGGGGSAKWAQVTTLREGKKLKSPNYKRNPKFFFFSL